MLSSYSVGSVVVPAMPKGRRDITRSMGRYWIPCIPWSAELQERLWATYQEVNPKWKGFLERLHMVWCERYPQYITSKGALASRLSRIRKAQGGGGGTETDRVVVTSDPGNLPESGIGTGSGGTPVAWNHIMELYHSISHREGVMGRRSAP